MNVHTLVTPGGLVKVTSQTGSILRAHTGVNIIATVTPQLNVATTGKVVDLTVQSDQATINGSIDVYRRPPSTSIVIYIVI